MQRAITGFHQDAAGDWVAELSCGHGQHVRHKPPFWSRPWVLAVEGRNAMVGAALPCVLCDRFEMPAGYVPYKQTPHFDQDTIPAGLQRDHSTKPGIWGVIHVVSGRLRYLIEAPLPGEQLLEPTRSGVVVPEVMHRVVPDGEVRFFVEFHHAGP